MPQPPLLTRPHEEGNAPTLNSFSDLQYSRAVSEGFFLNSQFVENRQEEIRHGGVLWISNVAPTLHPARCSARKDDGQRRMIVLVSVAHRAAVQNNRVIEQIAFSLLNRLEFLKQIGECADVVTV